MRQRARLGVNIDHIATVRFTFQVSDTKQLGTLMNQVRNIEGVFDVYRVTA